MEILYSKIISGCLIFLLTLVCGCGPFLLLRRFTHTGSRHRSRAASRINSTQAFACGIFIGTCLLHLLPEAAEDIQDSITSDLPLCEMLVAFGFLLLLVTENFILACHDRGGGGRNAADRERTVTVTPDETPVNDGSYCSERRTLMDGAAAPVGSSYGSMGNAGDGQTGRNGFATPKEGENSNNHNSHHHNTFQRNETQTEETQFSSNQAGGARRSDQANKAKTSEKRGGKKEEAENKTAVLKSFVLLFALSLHTVFDGLVVGLQSEETEVWTLLAAVGLHKGLVVVSIALSLLESHYNHPTASVLYLFLFSLVAPAGLAVGVILTETDFDTHAQTLTSGVLQSVATGTFMYVTFVESLKGRFDGRDRLLNVFLVLVGFGLVCGLRIVLPG